ncbi:MAG: aminotransferase [SAR324 cluster bacterium]|jgi:adenosylmethionine-8-amino-7-oxononanoate aminotransferase|nr:aminotransferase [SAR324 cluster bacterium]MCH2265340.1 aminotransferase [SAR324 cluster bacterium]
MENIAEIQSYDNEYFVHPWESMKSVGKNTRMFAENADGIYLYDENGQKLIDGPGGMWCVQIGYGRREMAEAISDQILKVPYYSPWNMSATPSAVLAKKLAELAPGDLNHVFFTTCGSTAVDSAIRFVHFYNNVLGRHRKKKVISREKSYHGSTYLSATMSGKARDKEWLDTANELVHFIPDVNPSRRPEGMNVEAFLEEKINDLETAIQSLGAENVGAFIAEPVLASGGVIVPPEGYHQRCLEVCRKHDVLYISDEVVTAFGRLGHWFASKEVFGIEPDIITCAKGLTSGYVPMGACIISDRIFSQISGDRSQDATFSNGYTYSGHPVSSAAALKNIEIIENENLLEHVREISPYFQQRLRELRKLPLVGDTRGVGLVGCVEGRIVEPENPDALEMDIAMGSRIDKHCQELGLIVRPLWNMCVFSPPLIITPKQIDEMFNILEQGILLATEELRQEGLWKG